MSEEVNNQRKSIVMKCLAKVKRPEQISVNYITKLRDKAKE